ncbi:sulfatase-like hydrolase/transferase [Actinocorallia sp. A-T 12471]|uniref:sulfatase-like hydrolase/transferase n=1 Tax=Actinocorallia sp. A-T 12471 TaxID=3089813 RepID=UPI0029D20CFA|nr:sulfatase-like hydrolase/transferase [Actinocorallia sp. A-T 12471]MDX6740796.1 sulfatase-like hydrolase/transferase [Actinocorallia sp. A-T 12471]
MGEAVWERRRVLTGLGALALGAAGCAGATHTPAPPPSVPPVRRPNFVVVLADDLGYGELGGYGQTKIATPHLDRLAAEGLRFTDAYASAPVCAPARASLFTGLHTGHSPVRRNPPRTGDLALGRLPTIATLLRDLGYRTGLFGKWGFSQNAPGPDHPNEHGFSEFFGYLTHRAAHDYYPERLWHNKDEIHYPGNTGREGVEYGPELVMRHAEAFLDVRSDEPFLMFVTPNLPHAPAVAPDLGHYAVTDWTDPAKAHAAQVTLLDSYVGRLLDRLRASALDRETVVIFSSDNGPHEEGGVDPDFFKAAGPFRGYKRNLYEGGIRVPLIIWSPHLLAGSAGRSTARPAVHYDMLPTLVDLAGGVRPDGLDGVSLRGLLTAHGDVPEDRPLFWFRTHFGTTPSQVAEDRGRGDRTAAATRQGRWKAVGFGPGREYRPPGPDWRFELYDLATDPAETTDLAAYYPEILNRLTASVHAAWTDPAVAV